MPNPSIAHSPITLRVNGRDHTLQVDPQTPLLYILRNDLGLKAAKFACGLEQCGACKVLFDGVARPSCRLPAAAAQGHEIVTLEGLGTPDAPHPVQTAFLAEQAAQCGYCTAGMIVAAAALLDQTPGSPLGPTDAEIRAALGRHICRCGAYNRILDAVHRASTRPGQRSGQEVNA